MKYDDRPPSELQNPPAADDYMFFVTQSERDTEAETFVLQLFWMGTTPMYLRTRYGLELSEHGDIQEGTYRLSDLPGSLQPVARHMIDQWKEVLA